MSPNKDDLYSKWRLSAAQLTDELLRAYGLTPETAAPGAKSIVLKKKETWHRALQKDEKLCESIVKACITDLLGRHADHPKTPSFARKWLRLNNSLTDLLAR